MRRATRDRLLFENYISNHEPSHFSHKGYPEWQGSEAQKLLLEDIEAGLHEDLEKITLWESRPEYCEAFPLEVFRDKIAQEVRAAKYLHTLKVKGKQFRAS